MNMRENGSAYGGQFRLRRRFAAAPFSTAPVLPLLHHFSGHDPVLTFWSRRDMQVTNVNCALRVGL